MKGIRKNGFKGVAVAAALSMTMTTMVSPAATAIPTGRWEQSMQTGAWKYRSVTGEYAADQWLFENGKWYRFDKDGNMITGWYQNPVTKDWYYLWANGSMATGWVPVGGRWYYLSVSGEMAHDGTTPDGYKVNATVLGLMQTEKSMMHRVVSRRHPEKDPVEVMDLRTAIQEAVPAGIPPTVEIQATMEAVLKMAEAPISVGTIQVITEARTIVEIIPETTETQAIAETIPEIMKIQGTMETIPAAMKNRETAEMIPEKRKLRRQKLLL